jgi:hypothetical protein
MVLIEEVHSNDSDAESIVEVPLSLQPHGLPPGRSPRRPQRKQSVQPAVVAVNLASEAGERRDSKPSVSASWCCGSHHS